MQAELQESLAPYSRRPVPLPHDFYRTIVDINSPEIHFSEILQLDKSRTYETEIAQIAEEIVDRNETKIYAASRRLAASTTPTPRGPMFNDLVSVNFDEKKFIESAENRLEKQRQAAIKPIRRPSC